MSAAAQAHPAPQPFIARLEAQNFRCLRDVTIDFAPLTVLVGPNASGKSTILDALQKQDAYNTANAWRGSDPEGIALTWTHHDGRIRHAQYAKNQNKFMWQSQLIRLDARELRKPNQPAVVHQLDEFGSNLTNLFASLTRRQQDALVRRFQQLVPPIQDVNVTPINGGQLELRFTDAWDEAQVYTPAQVSDGTMFALAFLCLQQQPQPPDLLLIEEPERGLHPYLMEQVMGMLRALAHGTLGPKPVQVVMATHSAELLDYAQPEEVRFINRRRDDGSTTVYAPDTQGENWREVFALYEGSLSGIWLSGTAGGVPDAR